MKDPAKNLFNDLETSDQAHWIALLKPVSIKSQTTPLTRAAYEYVPTACLFTEIDQPLPLGAQQMMVRGVKDKAGIDIREFSCKAGHSPHLSLPEEVVKVIEELAK